MSDKLSRKNFIKNATLMGAGAVIAPYTFSKGSKKIQEKSGGKELPDQLLLKDWYPKSIYKIPITNIKKAKFPVTDMHAHNYTHTDSEIKKRSRILDIANVTNSVVFVTTTGKKFDSDYAKYSKYKKFHVFCGIDLTGYLEPGWSKKAVKELNRCVEVGAVGVGELVDKGAGIKSGASIARGLHPDDPKMDPIWEECGKLGIPINLHMADPIWMYEPMDNTNDGLMRSWTWRVPRENRAVTHDGLVKIAANTLKRHPNTTFVLAHLVNCVNDLSMLGRMFDEYPNFYVDIGARFSELSTIPRYAAEFLTKYQDRIVYGTDYGWEVWKPKDPYGALEPSLLEMYRMTFRVLETQDEHFYMTKLLGYKWPMYGFGLNDSALKKIYHGNADKILKM